MKTALWVAGMMCYVLQSLSLQHLMARQADNNNDKHEPNALGISNGLRIHLGLQPPGIVLVSGSSSVWLAACGGSCCCCCCW